MHIYSKTYHIFCSSGIIFKRVMFYRTGLLKLRFRALCVISFPALTCTSFLWENEFKKISVQQASGHRVHGQLLIDVCLQIKKKIPTLFLLKYNFLPQSLKQNSVSIKNHNVLHGVFKSCFFTCVLAVSDLHSFQRWNKQVTAEESFARGVVYKQG